MSEFKNVSIVKQANVYFDGGVTSRTINFATGETKTLGIMLLGEYEFNTGKRELMEIQQGDVDVLLPGETEWKNIKSGETFEVKENASFKIKVNSLTDYCCSFLD
jgi:uncharacterized protein YaiE (UPF0345 family)